MKKLPAMLRIGLIAMLTCFLLFSSSYAAENGLVAHYKFKTDFNDSSGNGFNGSIVGAVSLVEDDVVEKHAVFNGGFINIANGPSLQLQNTFTLSVWVLVDSVFLVKRNSEKNRAKIRNSPFGNPKKIAGHFCLMRACFMR